ncbi:substrate-binding periplasmic protein [Chitinibacteraceae bacterium HSL-7]
MALWLAPVLARAETPIIHVAHLDYERAPMLALSSGKPAGGLLYELGNLLAAQLGGKAEHRRVSLKALKSGLGNGEIDLACHVSPVWWPELPGRWTRQLFAHVDRLVIRHGSDVSSLSAGLAQVHRLGVLASEHPARVDVLFAGRHVTVVTEKSVVDALAGLMAGRSDALMLADGDMNKLLETAPEYLTRIQVLPQPLAVVQTQCIVSPRSRLPLSAVDEAITQLIKDGEVARLLLRYQMSQSY